MELVVEQSQYEIERGKPTPSKFHSHLQFTISKLIDRHYWKELDVFPELSIMIKDNVKIPDIAFFEKGIVNVDFNQSDEVKVSQLPLCVVEILSPKQNIGDLLIKAKHYFAADVKSYWLVVPEMKAIFVYSNSEDYEVYKKTEILKDEKIGLELNLSEVF